MTPSGETRRIQLVRRCLTNWENTATPISYKKPPTCDENTSHVGGFVFLFTDAASIELRPCRDVVVDHEQVQVFFAVFLVDGADDHAAAVDAHHLAWWQVGESSSKCEMAS